MMFDSTFGKLLTKRVASTIRVNNANTSGLKQDTTNIKTTAATTNKCNINSNNIGKSEPSEAEIRFVVRLVVEEQVVYNGKVEEVTQLDCEEVSRIVSRIAWDGAKDKHKETTKTTRIDDQNENVTHVESNTQDYTESSKCLENKQRSILSPVSSTHDDENNELVQTEIDKPMPEDESLGEHHLDVCMTDVEKESPTLAEDMIAQENKDNKEDLANQIGDNKTKQNCDTRTTTEQASNIVCETTNPQQQQRKQDDSTQIQEKSGVQDEEVKIEEETQSPTTTTTTTTTNNITDTINTNTTTTTTSTTDITTATATTTNSATNIDLERCPQKTRQTLSTSNSNNMIGQLTRQSKVFARWSDNHFYPGTILKPAKDRKFFIGFFDGATRTVAETDLIPLCNIGGKQVRITIAKNYCVNANVLNYMSINDKPMFEVEYQQNGIVKKCVPLEDIFLTGEQGTPLIEPPVKHDKNPDESMFAGVDLDNIVHVKRSRRLQELEDLEAKGDLSGTPPPPPQGNRRKRGQYNMRHTASRSKPSSGAYNVENSTEKSHKRYSYSNGGQDTPASSCSPVDIKTNLNGPNSNPPSEGSNSTEHSNITEVAQEFYFNSSSSPHRTETSPLS